MRSRTLLTILLGAALVAGGCLTDGGEDVGASSTEPGDDPAPTTSNGTAPGAGDDPSQLSNGTSEGDVNGTGAWNESFQHEGHILAGVGATLPEVGPFPVEVLVTRPLEFPLREGATSLTVTLTWDGGPAGHDLTLVVWDPEGTEMYVDEGGPGAPDSPAVLEVEDPRPGTWQAMGWTNGASVDLTYALDVRVEGGS